MKIIKSLLWLAFNISFCFAMFTLGNHYGTMPEIPMNKVVWMSVICGAYLTVWCSSWWARTEKKIVRDLRGGLCIYYNMIRSRE